MTIPAGEPGHRFASYDDFIAGQAEVARQVVGADRMDWNGTVGPTPKAAEKNRTILGRATWDGGLLLNEERVQRPLKEVFASPGTARSDDELKRVRDALKTVFHEDNHLMARAGSLHRKDTRRIQQPHVRAIEEGVTEAYVFANLDKYIQATGFDRLAPGIDKVEGKSTYHRFAPAANALARGIADRSGLSSNEVLRRMTAVNRAEKWQVATELLYQSSDLPQLVREQDREAVMERIADPMRARFDGLQDLKVDTDKGITANDVRMASRAIGEAAIEEAKTRMADIEREYRDRQRRAEQERRREADRDREEDREQDREDLEEDRERAEDEQQRQAEEERQREAEQEDPAVDAASVAGPAVAVAAAADAEREPNTLADRPSDLEAAQDPDAYRRWQEPGVVPTREELDEVFNSGPDDLDAAAPAAQAGAEADGQQGREQEGPEEDYVGRHRTEDGSQPAREEIGQQQQFGDDRVPDQQHWAPPAADARIDRGDTERQTGEQGREPERHESGRDSQTRQGGAAPTRDAANAQRSAQEGKTVAAGGLAAAGKAIGSADNLVEAASPTGRPAQSQNWGMGRHQRPGDLALRRTVALATSGQAPASRAAEPPTRTPQPTPHSGAHTPGQFNQRLHQQQQQQQQRTDHERGRG